MHKDISLKFRSFLDSPVESRGSLFWFFAPFLFLVSFLVFVWAYIKRFFGYNTIEEINCPQNLKIICVGNVIMGGTGKSPLVQYIAQKSIENGFLVAIASRGIGKVEFDFNSLEGPDFYSKINHLSDENKEHAILLKQKFPEAEFFIFQNKKRIYSVKKIISNIQKKNITSKVILILDDGLQHFGCPRHLNASLWQTHILQRTPLFSFPMGCFREGFGQKSFIKLIQQFDYRIWSRTKPEKFESYKNAVSQTLSQFKLSPNVEKDFIVTYKIKSFKVNFADKKFEFFPISFSDFECPKNLSIVTGIAHPDAFFKNLVELNPSVIKASKYFLRDHGNLNLEVINKISNSDGLLLTLKDFLRWAEVGSFFNIIDNKPNLLNNTIIFTVDVDLRNLLNQEIDLGSFLCLEKM